MSLFGNMATSGRPSAKNLVEFRAGKMSLKGTMVTPDKRKGLVYVRQSDDSLIHFCWKDRTTGKVEDDLIIFPDDCEFKRVAQCTTGRVYILKFKSSSRKFFFWMQEPKTDKDDDHCKKVNESLNNPPAPGQSAGSDLGGMDQMSQGNLQDLFSNLDQQQLLQLMAAGGGLGGNLGGLGSLLSGGAGGRQSGRSSGRTQTTTSTTTRTSSRPATTTAATPAAAVVSERASTTPAPVVNAPSPVTPAATPSATDSATPGLQLSQLQNILSQMGVQPGAAVEPIDLSKAITPDVMIPILANGEVQERLKPYLPQGESIPSTAEELRATVKSAQFRQAMSSFSEALATGQLGPVLKQFGLPNSAQDAAAKGDVEGFARAMQESESKSSEKKDKEEDMVVE